MYRFWQLDQGWVASPRPEETTSLHEMMIEDGFRLFHDGMPLSRQAAEDICSGKHPWFLIHSQDGQLIGVIALLRGDGKRAEVFLHLRENWRGKGIGAQALERMKTAAALGMHLEELYARVLTSNAAALSFFRRYGFDETGALPANLWVPDAKPSRILQCSLKRVPFQLSVIVPMHNSEAWIRRCVASLGSFPCEILLIDDASDDGTVHICRELEKRDARIRLIRLASCGMAGAARNAGMREASGDYLFFLDSDDAVSDPNILSRMAERAAVSQCDCILTCQYERRNGTESRLVRLLSPFTGHISPAMRPKLFARQFPVWMAWYRRDFLKEHGFYFPEHVSYEDNYFSLVLVSEVQSVCSVPGTMVCHEIRSQSLSHIPEMDIQTSFFQVTDLCLQYVEKHSLQEKYPCEIAFWYIYAVFFTALHVYRTMFSDQDWIIREAICRLKRHFPSLWEHHADASLPPADWETLRNAWDDIDGLVRCEGMHANENL